MNICNRIIKIGLILLLSGIPLCGGLAYHFYFLFPNSHILFGWKHTFFSHLEFHTDQWDYQPGDSIRLYVSNSKANTVQVRMYDPLDPQHISLTTNFNASFQHVSGHPAISGTQWQATGAIALPEDFLTGWYVIEIDNGKFIKRSSVFVQPKIFFRKKKVALILSTNTWNAYNHWGGQSLYTQNHTATVSSRRPQLAADPFLEDTYAHHQLYYQAANKDLFLAELLDTAGIGFDVFSDDALELLEQKLLNYETLIFSTHTEYWTWNMIHQLNRCLDSGASALFLAGNVAAYVTDFDLTTSSIKIHPTRGKEGFWQIEDSSGIRPFGTQYSYFGFQTYAPYEVRNIDSWVWEGIPIEQGELIGTISDAYDYTPAYDQWWKNIVGLRKRGEKGAASGLEIDKLYDGTPPNWVQLAAGINSLRPPGHGEIYPDSSRIWTRGTGADMGFYEHAGGGIVFHASSMAFTGALPYDAKLRQLILNLIKRGH